MADDADRLLKDAKMDAPFLPAAMGAGGRQGLSAVARGKGDDGGVGIFNQGGTQMNPGFWQRRRVGGG